AATTRDYQGRRKDSAPPSQLLDRTLSARVSCIKLLMEGREMHAPVASGWASLVVYVDGAVVVGAGVLAVIMSQRRQGAPGGANRRGLAAAALVGWLGIVLALASAHAFQSRSQGVPWIALGVGAPIVVGFAAFFLSPQVRRIVDSIPQAWLLAVQWPRVVGAIFLVLLAEHRVPAVFARPAGWGDVLHGVLAPPVPYD